jgi:uncharacterized beta-barrel protein YwiB (DUF1934 family)
MTKEVLITIKGQQDGSGEEPVVVTACGIYHFTNGKHYIQYEEKSGESEEVFKNMMKISSNEITLSKKGTQSSQMVFQLNESDQAIYQTPYGSFSFVTDTKSIVLKETNKRIEVRMEYSLSADGSKVSDNEITIFIEEGN